MRAIFFDPDDAEAVAARLRRDGYEAEVVRERLSGEDDDEDHPWAVLADAPEPVLDVLCDEYDGWLDTEDAPRPPGVGHDPAHDPARGATGSGVPLELPTAPRRVKRPGAPGVGAWEPGLRSSP